MIGIDVSQGNNFKSGVKWHDIWGLFFCRHLRDKRGAGSPETNACHRHLPYWSKVISIVLGHAAYE